MSNQDMIATHHVQNITTLHLNEIPPHNAFASRVEDPCQIQLMNKQKKTWQWISDYVQPKLARDHS